MPRSKHSNQKNSTSSSNNQRTSRTPRAPKARDPKSKLKILDNHAKAVIETEKYIQTVATVRSHNLKIMKMIEWVQKNYKSYAKTVVIKLTSEQMKNKDLYYKSTHDFKYNILEADMVKAYLSANKIKSIDVNGRETYYSFDYIRKFKDAILFGAKRARKIFLKSFRLN